MENHIQSRTLFVCLLFSIGRPGAREAIKIIIIFANGSLCCYPIKVSFPFAYRINRFRLELFYFYSSNVVQVVIEPKSNEKLLLLLLPALISSHLLPFFPLLAFQNGRDFSLTATTITEIPKNQQQHQQEENLSNQISNSLLEYYAMYVCVFWGKRAKCMHT